MQEKQLVMVKLEDIVPNRFQPRLNFEEEALNELVASIKVHGIIQPLILRKLGDKFEIIAGERRFKAATLAGFTEVPAVIMELDDQTSAELALIENIQRKDLNAIEEAKSYQNILQMGELTQEQLAVRLGKSQAAIANKIRLLNLTPEVQDALMKNAISERHARSLLQLKDSNLQNEVLNKIVNERMNVKSTDDYIKLLNNPQNENNTTILENIQIPEQVVEPLSPINNPPMQDVINLNELNQDNEPVLTPYVNDNMQQALNNLNIFDANSNVFNDVEPLIEDKTQELPVINNLVEPQTTGSRFFPPLDQVSPINVVEPTANVEMANPQVLSEQPTMTIPTIEPVMPKPEPISPENINMVTQTPIVEVSSNVSNAINTLRGTILNVESQGYKIETQESDLPDYYQITIKIQKSA